MSSVYTHGSIKSRREEFVVFLSDIFHADLESYVGLLSRGIIFCDSVLKESEYTCFQADQRLSTALYR